MIWMTRDSLPRYTTFDYHAVCMWETGAFLPCFATPVTSKGRRLFAKIVIWMTSRSVGRCRGGRGNRHRYWGTQCLGTVMSDFPARLGQRYLGIALQLTSVIRHLPQSTLPGKIQIQKESVCVREREILHSISFKVCFFPPFLLGKKKDSYILWEYLQNLTLPLPSLIVSDLGFFYSID